MQLFTKLFGSLLVFVYHCFDRIVIHGYLSALSRPEQVVYFFRQVVGVAAVDKEVLSRRTGAYQGWVEAFARNHDTPIEWAQKGVRKEDYVQRWLRPMVRAQRYGVYFIFRSMEQGPTFRCTVPRYPTRDPNHRILAPQRSRFTHYYFYIRDETLGPIAMRVASFFPFQTTYYLNGHSFIEQELNRAGIGFRKHDNAFLAVDDPAALQAAADRLSPALIRDRLDYWTLLLGPKFSARERARVNLHRFYAISQIEYCRNFIFKRHFPIHKIFERSCELGLWRLSVDKISEIFGTRITHRLHGNLNTTLEQIEHGHHIFRAYWKHAFVKQYEKFATFLRNEICSNNLADFGLRKGLEHLGEVREKFLGITGRFATFQARCLNAHVDFPLLQRLALPITVGSARYPGIKIHDARIIRLMQVLLHAGTTVSGWRCPATPRGALDELWAVRQTLWPEPIALRPAKDARPRTPRARRQPIRLAPHRQGRKSRPAVRALPPALIWTACQQPLSPPPRRQLPARQQTRKGHAQSRRLHTQAHSAPGRNVKLLYSFCPPSKA